MSAVTLESWVDTYGQPDVWEKINATAKSSVNAYIFSGPPSFPRITSSDHPTPETILRAGVNEFAANLFAEKSEVPHPNLRIIEPEGRTFRVADVENVIKEVMTSPRDGAKEKVVVCDRFHTADESTSTRLLKIIEEPPESSILILLSEAQLPQTIVSRCLEITFRPIPKPQIMNYLVNECAVGQVDADTLADSAEGDIGRAHFLAMGGGYKERIDFWLELLSDSFSDTGGDVASASKQAARVKEFLDSRNKALSDVVDSEEDIKREKRRIRDAELKFGFAVLARAYRDKLGTQELDEFGALQIMRNIDSLSAANESLEFNPNESALLANLFFELT